MSGPLRVLVCGGREFSDVAVVERALGGLNIELVITGGSTGADRLAEEWAARHGAVLCVFPANWSRFRSSAGPMRNRWMIQYGKPDLVVAFPGGRGTEDMIRKAEEAGISVRRIAVPA